MKAIGEKLKQNKHILILIGLLTCSLIIMLLPYISAGKPFTYGGDVRTQWYPFYYSMRKETVAALKSGTLPFYSWNMFLGTNLWASKSYYGLFDIYNILSYFIDAHYYVIYEIFTCIKVLVSGITFYIYIRSTHSKKEWAILSSLCYALSSWAIYYMGQPGFLSFFSFMPLYFWGMERYLQNNKTDVFMLSVCLLMCISYYFCFTISMFSPIYFIYRYYNLNKTLKGFFKSALKLVFFYMIGIFMSGIVLVPTFFYMMANDRVGSMSMNLFYDNPLVYLHQLVSALAPSHVYIYRNNVFQTLEHISSEICLYCGTLTVVLIPQIFKEKDKFFKKSTIILYIILILLTTPFGSSLMHGFSEYSFRWMMLFILCNLFVANHYLNRLNQLDHRLLIISSAIECIVVLGCFGLGIKVIGSTLSENLQQGAIFSVILFFVILNTIVLLKRGGTKCLIAITYVECTLFLFLCIGSGRFDYSDTWEFIDSVTSVLEQEKGEFNYYLDHLSEENTGQYYRVYVPVDTLYWDYSYNMNIFYDIQGLTTYDSAYAPSFTKMRDMAWSKISVAQSGWEFDIQDSDLMSFLNTKYSVTTTIEEIPFNNYDILDDSYMGGLFIAENLDYRPLGTTYNTVITYEEYESGKNTDSFLNSVIVEEREKEEIINLIKSNNCFELKNISYEKNYLYGDISVDAPSFMVITLPYDEGWKILVNGEKTKVYEVSGGMMGIALGANDNRVEMYFIPKGLKVGLIMTIIGCGGFFASLFIPAIKQKRTKK